MLSNEQHNNDQEHESIEIKNLKQENNLMKAIIHQAAMSIVDIVQVN